MNNIANKPNYNKARASYNFTEGAPVVVTDIDIPAQQLGKTAIATTAGEREIPIQYAVVDADQVLTSNDINGSVNPAYTDQSISAIRAVAGNGRLTGLVNSYQRGKSQQYRSSMEADTDHGINPDVIKGMKNPILVRIMPKSEVTADIGDVSNTPGITDLTAVEQAKNDANRIDLRALSFGEDGGLSNKAYYDFIKAMPESEQGKMMTNGKPSQAAKTRLNNAVFWSAYGNEELISLYAESTDQEAKNILNALASAAPYMQAVKGTVGDVRGPTVEAAISAVNATRAGLSLEKYALTPDFTVSDDARKLINYFAQNSRSGKRIGEKLRSIASIGFEEANKPEQDLMGEVPKKSISQIIDDGLKEEENQTLFSLNKENKPKKATPKELKMQKDLEGKSMVQAAQYLITNAPDSFQKFVAKKVLNVMQEMQARGVDLHFEVQTGDTRNSKLYNAEGLTTHIFGKEGRPLRINLLLNGAPVFENQRGYPSGLSYKTLMHEMLHAETSAKIYYLSDTHPAVKELNDLYKLVAEEYKKQRRDGTLPEFLKRFNNGLNNALDNSNEMLTWSMTDKDMQQWMNSIKVGDKTVFSKIIDLIRQVLGISKPFETALDRLVRTTDSLLDMDIQVLEDGVIAKGHTFGPSQSKKKMPTQQQTLFSKRAQQLFTEDELTDKLQFGKKEEPTPTASGQRSLDALASVMGRTVKPPEPGQIERLNKAIKEANKNKQETIDHYKSVGEKHLAYLETKIFSSDAAIQREYEKQIRAMGETDSVKMGMLMSLRTSQAVHHEGVAGVFLQAGDLDYEQETHKWKGKESKDNFKALAEQIQEMRKRNNFSQEQADLIYHTALETKQVAQMIEQNKTLPADKQKIIHITDPNQLAVGMQLFKDHPELNKAVEIWNGIRRNAVEVMVKGGLYSRADAEFLLDNTDYVPMYREMDPEADGGPVTAMRGLRAEKDKKRTGSMRAVNDIFDNQIRWVEYAISRSVKAYQARTMMDAAVDFGIATKFNPQVTPASRMKNVVKIWRGGNEEHYSMEDPLFMDAFVGLQSAAIPMFKWAAKMSNMLRESVVLYPLFSVSQVAQDSIAAVFSSGLKPQYALKIPVLAVKELFQTMRNTSANHTILKQYASVGVQDVNATVVRVNAEQMLGMKGKPGFLGAIKKQLNNFAMAADNSVRQATYQAALDSGLSHSEALEKSFEIFNVRRRGTSKKLAMAGQVIPFFPAYLAAQNVAYNILMGRGTSPTQRAEAHKTLAQTTASVMVLSMLYAMMNGDDDDYLKKPAIQRDRLLMIPGTGGISIPMRSDVFLFPKILAEHTYLMLTDKGYEDGRKFRESMYNALVNSLSSPTVVPQIFKPALEVYVNYDFFQGRPVIGTYQKSKETAYKFNEGTSELSKALGQTGLIAPINADHLIRGMFGSVGGLTLYITNQLIDYANPNSERTSMSTQDMIATLPGTSAFVSKSSESALKRDFYALKEEVDKVTNTFNDIKKNNPNEVPDFIASPERMARIGLSKTVNKISDQLGKINTAIKQINNNPNLTGDQKQQQIEAFRNAENQMLKGVDVKRLREIGMM
jgi:vacuolar-type H+-ATPase subunit H